MSEIHKNRGNRRRRDKLKRKHKYNLVQSIWGDAKTYLKGILGMYDKGKIHDTENYRKTNNKKASQDYMGCDRLGNNYSTADKRKIESCNEKLKDYETGKDEIDAMVVADIESYYESENEESVEWC